MKSINSLKTILINFFILFLLVGCGQNSGRLVNNNVNIMKYNTIIKYSQGEKLQFPDFTLEFMGIKEVKSDKWTFKVYPFEVTNGNTKITVEWCAGTGDIAPQPFVFMDKEFELILGAREIKWASRLSLKENKIIVIRKRTWRTFWSNLIPLKAKQATEPPGKYFEGIALEIACAIDKSDTEAVRKLSHKVNLNEVHRHDMTLLYYALVTKKFSMVTELIRLGANPEQTDNELGSPLNLAVQANDSSALASMLNAGISPNAVNKWGTPIIFTAAGLNSAENLKLLVQRGADVNMTDKNLGKTAIFDAITNKCYDNAVFLIENGAKVDVTTKNGLSLAYSVQWEMEHQSKDNQNYTRLETIKKLMGYRGVKFPASPPLKK